MTHIENTYLLLIRLRAGQQKIMFESQKGQENFFFAKASRAALGLIKPPIQWMLETLSLGVNWPVHKTDHSPHPVLRLGMSGPVHPLSTYAFKVCIGTTLPL
jgi:hypothetical protein